MANNLEDTYAPNWLPYFTPDGRLLSGINLAVDCGICGSSLAITQPDDDEHQTFAVLPCGHVFGHRCITEWINRNQSPTCPTCRKSLQHLVCGHKVRPREILPEEFNIHRNLEVVLPAGEDLPSRCAPCQADLDRRTAAARPQAPRLGDDFARLIQEAERAANRPRAANPVIPYGFDRRREPPAILYRTLGQREHGAREFSWERELAAERPGSVIPQPRPRVNLEEEFERMRMAVELNRENNRPCTRCHRPRDPPTRPQNPALRQHEGHNPYALPPLNPAPRGPQPAFFVHPAVRAQWEANHR